MLGELLGENLVTTVGEGFRTRSDTFLPQAREAPVLGRGSADVLQCVPALVFIFHLPFYGHTVQAVCNRFVTTTAS